MLIETNSFTVTAYLPNPIKIGKLKVIGYIIEVEQKPLPKGVIKQHSSHEVKKE